MIVIGSKSQYTDYLPPILWEGTRQDPTPFLARFLCIFEKILTGIDDSVALPSPREGVGSRPYAPLETTIDRLNERFDPSRTGVEMLPWLASWAALELRPDWDESQRRSLTSGIVKIYQKRWLKHGLYTYLDIYASTKFRPRIAIDDGEALLRISQDDRGSPQTTPFGFSRLFSVPERSPLPFLLHPTALAVGRSPSGFYLVAADGGRADNEAARRPAIWRLSATGEPLDWDTRRTTRGGDSQAIPVPRPVNDADFVTTPPATQRLGMPVAVVVEDSGAILVLDQGGIGIPPGLYRYVPQFGPNGATTFLRETIASGPALKAVLPLDMAYDLASKTLFILDRGASLLGTVDPRLVVLKLPFTSAISVKLTQETNPYNRKLIEPTALTLAGGTRLVVTDAGAQTDYDVPSPAPPTVPYPYSIAARRRMAGDLVQYDFDPATPDRDLVGLSLLKPDPAAPPPPGALPTIPFEKNKLIWPTGIANDPREPDVFLVCDNGLKSEQFPDDLASPEGAATKSNRWMAEPAQVYRVDLKNREITSLTPGPGLIQPSALVIDPTGAILVADAGESQEGGRDWRASPHAFGVSVYFSGERITTEADRTEILNGVAAVLNPEQPAHTTWTFRV